MKNIHVLPTEKPTRLFTADSEIRLAGYPKTTFKTGRNIYITSDDELKDGDWCILLENHYLNGGIGKYNSKKAIGYGLHNTTFFQKIILTTDQDLIKDGVQAIDDEFLEWFIKNTSCEEVKIEKEQYYQFVGNTKLPLKPNYKIIIPTEGPKLTPEFQEVIEFNDKIYKQETLEELAKKAYPHHPFVTVEATNKKRKAFIKGYQLAQEQDKNMYSEEDMQEYAEFCIRCYNEGLPCIVAKDWVKKFKKK